MNCPVCNIPLMMTDKQGVEVDYCQKCRGVWLDRGELDKIIERSYQPQYNKFSGEHEKHHHDDHIHDDQYRYNKKKNFLSDIFDF